MRFIYILAAFGLVASSNALPFNRPWREPIIEVTPVTVTRSLNNFTTGVQNTETQKDGMNGVWNGGLINSKGEPYEIEFGDPQKLIINAYGSNYNLTDLFTMGDFIFDEDSKGTPDIDFFRFSDENLAASRQELFYSLWSIHAQRNPQFKELGEFGLFSQQFLADYQFDCNFDNSVCSAATNNWREIMDIYPDNRPLARKIYFSLKKFAYLHDMTKAIENTLDRAHSGIQGRVPGIINSFTHQIDPKRIKTCNQIKQAMSIIARQVATIGFGAVFGASGIAVGGFRQLDIILGSNKYFSEGFRKAAPGIFGNDAPKGNPEMNWAPGGFNAWYAGLKPEDKANDKRLPYAINIDPMGTLELNILSWGEMIWDNHIAEHIWQQTGISTGYDTSVVCGAWGGAETDLNPQNREKLHAFLSKYFDGQQKQIRTHFRSILEGRVIMPGYPTLMALLGQKMKWSGPEGIQQRIRDMEPLKDAVLTETEKGIISSVMIGDGSWVYCTRSQQAETKCMKAREGREGKNKFVSKAEMGRFCPDHNDTTVICQAGRWAHGKYFSHVHEFPALHTFETYASPYFKMNFESAMQEAWSNYKRRGNNMTDEIDNWAYGHVRGNGLRLPFCENDQLLIKDYDTVLPWHQHSRQWEFPAICGPRGVDTLDFLKAVGVANDSEAYNFEDKWVFGKMGQLFRDRIPRILNRLSPIQSYQQYCIWSISFPTTFESRNQTKAQVKSILLTQLTLSNGTALSSETLDKAVKERMEAIRAESRNHLFNQWKVSTGRDLECDMVDEKTKAMNEFDANVWFCVDEGKGKHTVFERERGHIDLSTHPTGRIDSHGKKCKKWIEEHSFEIAHGQ